MHSGGRSGLPWSIVLGTPSIAVALMPFLPTAQAQSRDLRLRPADRTYTSEFTAITSLRELSDGSLLVTDARDNRLAHLEWAPERATLIGRVGGGPGEYNKVGFLHPLAGDSTLLTDVFLGRWLLLAGARIVATIPADRTFSRQLGHLLAGVDVRGNVLATRDSVFLTAGPRLAGNADSVALLMGDRGTGSVQVLGLLIGPGGGGVNTRPMARGGTAFTVVPLRGSGDLALLTSEGWVAIARSSPYRVDWRSPAGRWIRGGPLPFTRVPVNDQIKCASLRAYFNPDAPCDLTLEGWPTVVPPFLPPGRTGLPTLMATPDDGVAIARTFIVGGQHRRYDFVDRQGMLLGILTLKPNEALAGFGASSLYVVVKDGDDIQTIRRHPWP